MNKTIRPGITIIIMALAMLSIGTQARAAIVNRSILKSFFETGDVPTGEQFANLIDSYIHQTDDGLTLVGIGSDTAHGDLRAARNTENSVINSTLTYADPSTHPPVQPDWAGFSGFLPLEYQDSTGQPHFGYLQMSMDSAALPPDTSPAIHVDYWVWDNSANTPVTAIAIPEPASIMGLFALIPLLRRRISIHRK